MDEDLADSSDEDCEGPTLHHAYDTMFDNNDGFPFIVGGAATSVTNLHPSSFQIFQLWQTYITNVNPLLKLSHTSSLQKQIIGAGAKLATIPKPLEALMFAIYFAAVTSMTAEEVQTEFGEDRTILLAKYHSATQQALVNAGFMRSNEIMTLQAFTLYLVSCDPNRVSRRYQLTPLLPALCPPIRRPSLIILLDGHRSQNCDPDGHSQGWTTVSVTSV